VLIVEDSRTQRELLVQLVDGAAGTFNVVGTASNGQEAVAATLRLRPDVVAMDIHLPIIDGYEATRQIMQQCPTPIVMISSSLGDAPRRSLDAQTVGALAVVRKPGNMLHPEFEHDRRHLITTLRLMADVPVVTRHSKRPPRPTEKPLPQPSRRPALLAVASSTGGPAAVQAFLQQLGPDFPLPILLAQHIARGFVGALVDWLNATTPPIVQLARSGEQLLPGHTYLAPDDHHLLVREWGMVSLRPPAPADRYCPSGDMLFSTVAAVYGRQAIGVIMTGMGRDGADGLLLLHQRGALTLAQDEASCVVFGMPQAAIALGAASRVEPLNGLAPAVLHYIGKEAGDTVT
jgi:two-component system chemotaxis response regulator CheB